VSRISSFLRILGRAAAELDLITMIAVAALAAIGYGIARGDRLGIALIAVGLLIYLPLMLNLLRSRRSG
jgi:uncharacterized oligopeptide transporter (OPT) family protein